jgi:hypothetical protein
MRNAIDPSHRPDLGTYEERAAIMEYVEGLTRAEAEARAER